MYSTATSGFEGRGLGPGLQLFYGRGLWVLRGYSILGRLMAGD